MNKEAFNDKIQKVCEEALTRTIPNEMERCKTLEFSEMLRLGIQNELKKAGLEAQVQVQGSIAKNTWLANQKDIDLFILIPKSNGREAFDIVLEIAKKVAGNDWLEVYAEHPYIRAKIENFMVDFVPCFRLVNADQVTSSVDRTPFHTAYIKKHLTPEIEREVRLLKRFMYGIGTYGAEIKNGGYSGYLCEILILYYNFFLNLLMKATNWGNNHLVDLEGFYKGRETKVREVFKEPLIVIDPVDQRRNVASAVRSDKLATFIAAARHFIKNPAIKYFYPEPSVPFSFKELLQLIQNRGSVFIFLKTNQNQTVPDVLWGQLYKSRKALVKLLCRHGFRVIRSDVWSDEESTSVFILEIQSRFLPAIEYHVGPPIFMKEDCRIFLEKYHHSNQVVSGPRIDGERWIVEKKRRYTNVVNLLMDELAKFSRKTGIASKISQAFTISFKIWVNEEVEYFYSANTDFAILLTEYLKGRPRWLQ